MLLGLFLRGDVQLGDEKSRVDINIAVAAAAEQLVLAAGRLLTGLASSWLATTVPVYIGEVACPHLRGTLAALFQVSVLEVIFINVHKMI